MILTYSFLFLSAISLILSFISRNRNRHLQLIFAENSVSMMIFFIARITNHFYIPFMIFVTVCVVLNTAWGFYIMFKEGDA